MEKWGYVEIPVSGKRFYKHHLTDLTPAKLLNYFVQAVETAYNIQNIQLINKLLEPYKTKLVTYNYDSFVFDVFDDESKILLPQIENILETYEFPIKKKEGLSLSF